ncbi:MAG TPA: tetratricopeptide repeat protein [Vicinamibacterales bacterium]|nr:tetratricopeptide repeat protein [Vicinamibacterales bacterium]
MKSESIAFAIAGVCFGVILGWIIGTQQVQRANATVAPAAQTAAAGTSSSPQNAAPGDTSQQQPPKLDEARVQSLTTVLTSDPNNADAAIQLANTYFDAEQYDNAIKWYEQGLKLKPNDADASTDLGVSYYYTKRTDDALKQFDHSLQLDPNHTKTLLNKGIVLAFGKQDLAGAEEAWKKVVQLAPNSPEGQAAQRGLEGIEAVQKGNGAAPASNQ